MKNKGLQVILFISILALIISSCSGGGKNLLQTYPFTVAVMDHIDAINNRDLNTISNTITDDFIYLDNSRKFDKKKYLDVMFCAEELAMGPTDLTFDNITVEEIDQNTFKVIGTQNGKLISNEGSGKYPREYTVKKEDNVWLISQIEEKWFCEPSIQIIRPIDESVPCYHSFDFLHEYTDEIDPHWLIFHGGYDYGYMAGNSIIESPVLAVADGTVIGTELDGANSYMVVDLGNVQLANGQIVHLYLQYFHIVPQKKVGDVVEKGQQIARLSRPEEYGFSPEVHFEMFYRENGWARRIDPMLLGLNSEIIPILFFNNPLSGLSGLTTVRDLGEINTDEVTLFWSDNCTGYIDYFEVRVNGGEWKYLCDFEDDTMFPKTTRDALGYTREFVFKDYAEGENSVSIRGISIYDNHSNTLKWVFDYIIR